MKHSKSCEKAPSIDGVGVAQAPLKAPQGQAQSGGRESTPSTTPIPGPLSVVDTSWASNGYEDEGLYAWDTDGGSTTTTTTVGSSTKAKGKGKGTTPTTPTMGRVDSDNDNNDKTNDDDDS